MKIAMTIPSMWRHSNAYTKWLFPNADIVVPESEREAYEEHYTNVITHPDDIKWLTPKLNRMMNYYFVENDYDCMFKLDDDILKFANMQKSQYIYIREEERIKDIITQAAYMAKDLWTPLFTFNNHVDYRKYQAFKPFWFKTATKMWVYWVLKTDLRMDERMVLKQDIDFSMQVLNKHRIVYQDTRYWFTRKPTFWIKWWCSLYRTTDLEEECIDALVRKWGKKNISKKRKNNSFTVDILF